MDARESPRGLYLRLSITDRCNFVCQYCRPEGAGAEACQALDSPSLVRLISLINQMEPVVKVRLTGGEPLLRHDLPVLARSIGDLLPGVTLCLTTNGSLLARRIGALVDAGVASVNVSMDSADPALFRQVTGGGDLAVVIAGLEAAREAGLGLKLNAVLQRRCADAEGLHRLVELGRRFGAEVRFIELMPMGPEARDLQDQRVGAEEALSDLIEQYRHLGPLGVKGTAARHLFSDGADTFTVGFIAPISHPFCKSCNRLRLDCRGRLYSCLRDARGTSLLPWLRDEALPASVHKTLWRGAGGVKSAWPERSMIATGG